MKRVVSRRTALKAAATLAALPVRTVFGWTQERKASLPIRTITRGPKHHWFGYYDKREFDLTNRYVLSNQVDFEHRTPTADDVIRVGMIDTGNNDQWIDLGRSSAWGWQQGCMLQWRGASDEVVWNDHENDRFVCSILNVKTRARRTLPRPIYALSPDGKAAITADFARIQRMRPGYGYVGLQDPCHLARAPEDSGVWRMDMETGDSKLIFSLSDATNIPHLGESLRDKWSYFNHLLVSPDGTRFVVLHRWRESRGMGESAHPHGRFTTRMFTVAMDGTDRYLLDASGRTSHFIWRDSQHVCAWTQPEDKAIGFYVLKDRTNETQIIGERIMNQDGHITYVPQTDHEWVLNDTYPHPKTRQQTPYLFHIPSGRRVDLGRFRSPTNYQGEWRCDTHPRSSNDGTMVAIDSPHAGDGRQVHLIDIREIIA